MLGLACAWRRAGRTVVFTNGCYDLLHPGHIRLLEQARSLGKAIRHPAIPLPRDLFAPERINSLGINLNDDLEVQELTRQEEPGLAPVQP